LISGSAEAELRDSAAAMQQKSVVFMQQTRTVDF
jgi:hypothetical protein